MSEPGPVLGHTWQVELAALPGAMPVEARREAFWMDAPEVDVLAVADLMNRLEFRLTAITGVALPDGETAVLYHYCRGGTTVNVRAESRAQKISSIASLVRAADWAEREIADLYGVQFVGHPHPVRLIRPPSLTPGFFRSPRPAEEV